MEWYGEIDNIHKLEIEMKHNRSERERMNTEHRIRSLDNVVSDTHSSLMGIRSSHELRVHKLDTKRVDQEKKIEANYRDLVRKIFNMENKMNVIAKAIRDAPELMEVKPRSGRKRKVAKAVKAKTVKAKAAAKKRKRYKYLKPPWTIHYIVSAQDCFGRRIT